MDIFSMVLPYAASAVIGVVIGPLAYGLASKLTRQIKAFLFDTVDTWIKDPAINMQIKARFWELERKLGSRNGKAKLEAIKQYAQRIIPGKLDDAIIERIVQGIYDEITKKA